jgi:ATP-binding protein involved in chromosome partitioning
MNVIPASMRPSAPSLEAAVRAAVNDVVDPLLDSCLGDLGLLEDVAARRNGDVTVTIRSLVLDGSHPADLRRSVEAAAGGVPGVRKVGVELGPLSQTQRAALAKRLRARNRRPGSLGAPTRVFGIASGKGGVGKSSLAANLAVALARSGQKVGVLDADVWGYSVPQLFGVRERPVAVKGMMLPVRAHDVHLMSIGFLVEDGVPVVWRGPMLRKALEQFLDDVYWGTLDVLLIDLPPGTGDVPLTILELLPTASLLVVTTPQKAAEQVAARVGRMALDARMPLAGVVENMTGPPFGSGGGQRLARQLGTPLLGQVPMDPRMSLAGDDAVPLLVSDPASPAGLQIREVAQALPAGRASLVGRSLPVFVD